MLNVSGVVALLNETDSIVSIRRTKSVPNLDQDRLGRPDFSGLPASVLEGDRRVMVSVPSIDSRQDVRGVKEEPFFTHSFGPSGRVSVP